MIIKLLAIVLAIYIIWVVFVNIYLRIKYTKEEREHFNNLYKKQKAERKRFKKMMKPSKPRDIFTPENIERWRERDGI